MDQVAVSRSESFSEQYARPLRALPRVAAPVQLALSATAMSRLVEAFARPAAVVTASGECLAANQAARTGIEWERNGHRYQLSSGALQASRGMMAVGLTSRQPETHYLLLGQAARPCVESQVEQLVAHWRLTKRQAQVLRFLMDGRCNKVMAREMSCAVRTVELHVSAALEKSGCATRAELIASAWRYVAQGGGAPAPVHAG